ncbi:MAG: EF-hand domain-containing protein [Sphingomonadaceae bacterium]|nr:EF-hand domain-containing protein [Sphingomonadaceae bacterium]
MLRILTASSILALAAVPAIAQQADPMAAPEAPETSTDAVTPAPAAEPAPAADPAPAPAAESRAATVAKLVDAEFPAYDANKNGELDEPEFSKWLLALHAAGGDATAKAMDDTTKAKWAKDGFAAADTDKSQKVSKAEMNKFLAG